MSEHGRFKPGGAWYKEPKPFGDTTSGLRDSLIFLPDEDDSLGCDFNALDLEQPTGEISEGERTLLSYDAGDVLSAADIRTDHDMQQMPNGCTRPRKK